MKYSDFFPSIYLKSQDLDGDDRTLTIKSLERKEFDDGLKPVLSFEEIDKRLILNRTNFKTIEELHGANTAGWIGQHIALYATEVDFRGNSTLAIRVRLKAPAAIGDEDIPF